MQTKQLIVNGIIVDFFDKDEDIPLIIQVNDLGDLQSLQGSGSKAFKLPLTQKNRYIFGFPDNIQFNTGAVYDKLPAQYIEDGLQLISNGFVEVQDVQDGVGGYIDVIALFGNIDFLDQLGGQIYDMGDSTTYWSGYGQKLVWNKYSLPVPNNLSDLSNCIWDVPHAAYSQKKTDGWIWPIVNYGDVDTTPPFNGHINVRNMRPGFFLHTAIELLVQSTGYTIDQNKSCLYNDPVFFNLYKKLIIQFSNSSFDHGTDWQNTPDNLGATYQNSKDQVVQDLPRVGQVTSSNIYQNGFPFEGVINFGPSDHYVATTNVDFTATVQFNLFMSGRFTGTPSEVTIKFVVINTDGTFTDFGSLNFTMDNSATRFGSGNGANETRNQTFLNQKLSQEFSLVAGQQLYVKYHVNNIGSNSESTSFIFYNGATFTIVTNEQVLLWQQPIQCERILPDVAQIDFLKDTLQRFGLILIADPNTGTIVFTSFKTIYENIPVAKNWSEKCVDNGKQVAFQLGSYCQVNWLRYQNDTAIPVNYLAKYYFDDHIDIADQTLNPTTPVQDLFTSIFGPSINSPYLGGTIAQISDPTSTEEFSVGNEPRLLIDQKLDLSTLGSGGQPLTVVFSDGDPGFESVTIPINDVISVPYFYKPDAPDLGGGAPRHLGWKDVNGLPGLRSTYYPYLQRILTQSKKVTRYIYLTPRDILEFDVRIPIYLRQDNAYYYVATIDSWVKGKPTKVDLVKL